MIPVLNWLLAHWYVFFWLSVFGVFESVRDFFLGIFETITGVRHRRRVTELQAQATLERAKILAGQQETPAGVKPGPCVHRNVVSVVSAAEEVVAWLCKTCDEKLPKDWAVREEDL